MALVFCSVSMLSKGIPPELLEQYGNLNIPKSFITYDTSSKYPVILPYTQVRALMPAPYATKNTDIFTRNNQKVLQQNYTTSLEDFGLSYVLYHRPVQTSDVKNSRAFFAEEKERMILQFGNYPVIEEVSATNAYYEFFSQNGKIHRLKLSLFANTLIGMLVSGNTPAIYAAPAEDFFASLELPLTDESSTEALLHPKIKTKEDVPQYQTKVPQDGGNSSYILQDSLFAITFYTKPLRNDFFIKNEIEPYQVVNFYTDKKNKNDQYLVSYRLYNKDIVATDVFFANASKVFAQSSKTEIIANRNLDFYKYPAKEYIFKNKKSKYIVRYFAKGNAFIQLVIKSKLKGENKLANIHFFDSFAL